MSVYAVSDLHGQYNTFIKGLEKIGFSDDDYLYVIGDAIDRGPKGIKILMHIKNNKNIDLIIGNHEFMMLNSVATDGKKKCNGQDAELWLDYNGGRKTFPDYGRLPVNQRKSLLEWLNSRYLIKTIEVGDRKFCLTHSYYSKALENMIYSEISYWDIWNIVWTSMYRYGDETRGENIYKDYPEYTFITGHVPVLSVMRSRKGRPDYNELTILKDGNLIDIDGACAMGYQRGVNNGALFLRLDDMKVFPIPLVEK